MGMLDKFFNKDDFFRQLEPEECMEISMKVDDEDALADVLICRTDETTIKAKVSDDKEEILLAKLKKRPMTKQDFPKD